MAKRNPICAKLLAEIAEEYRDAPVFEFNAPYRDVFQRAGEQISVELCHGIWRTFRRGSDAMPGAHPNREAAKRHALAMLGVLMVEYGPAKPLHRKAVS